MRIKQQKTYKISILGAGSWGSTLANLLSKKKYNVYLWTFLKEEEAILKKTRKIAKLKGAKLDKNIKITTNLQDAINGTNLIIIVVPSSVFESTVKRLKETSIPQSVIFLSATKGFVSSKCLRPSQILKKYYSKHKVSVLSGPNIALDVISQTPIISVIASKDINTASKLQKIISTKYFRVYINHDVTGVELGGALKNVIAIAAGISDGLGFSISSKAGLISRGLVEIAKIALAEGADIKSILGASGLGDLIATCCSKNSRNYKVGIELAKGKKLRDILKKLGQVAEGVDTTKSMLYLAKKHKIKTPIASAVNEIISKNNKPLRALNSLLSRPLASSEIEF